MKESKIHATERLRRGGRWDEASAYRDEVRERLRSDGKSKNEANQAAWDAMIEKFPAPAESGDVATLDPSIDDGDDESLDEAWNEHNVDLIRDTLWVYDCLERKRATMQAAPSPGAWSLLKWSRTNPDRFFENLLPKALAAKQKQPKPNDGVVEDPGIEEIERMLREFAGEQCPDCGGYRCCAQKAKRQQTEESRAAAPK